MIQDLVMMMYVELMRDPMKDFLRVPEAELLKVIEVLFDEQIQIAPSERSNSPPSEFLFWTVQTTSSNTYICSLAM